jgi:hypothetical protein
VRQKASGARRRALARLIRQLGLGPRSGKRGRPQGTADRTRDRLSVLHKELAWIGVPDLPIADLIEILQGAPADPKRSDDYNLAVEILQQDDFACRDHYKNLMIGERSLRRDVATIQRKIWGPKRK